MKRSLSIMSGLGIGIWLVSLLSSANPASAGAGSWSAEPFPSTMDMALGPPGIDVRDIAVAAHGTALYAVPGDSVSDNVIYRSTDAGVGWRALEVNIEADLVAVAPDDADMVAIASSGIPEVYLTLNGGSTWYSLGKPQESGQAAAAAIYDIAVSMEKEGSHYIAAAGKEAGDVANVWYLKTGDAATDWKETRTLTGFGSADEVAAVAFSPNFSSDQTLVAVSEDDHASVDLQILNLSSDKWNGSAMYAGYPETIVGNSGITGLTSASLSLAPDYLASEPDRRLVFIGLAVSGDAAAVATSGIYRLTNDQKSVLKSNVKIHSITFNGTSLVAGEYDSSLVHHSADPLAAAPAVRAVSDKKEPGGENRVVVARAGSKVVAGTSGNESAFAISRNNGDTFNDISLIDTAITSMRDVAISADGSKVYLVTDDGTDLSLWRMVSGWERVLSQRGTANYVLRIAPENADSIYLTKKNDTTIYYSESGGEAGWQARICGVTVQDLAVESADVAYALASTGSVSKSVDAGFTWGAATSTGLASGATIVSVGTNNLLVGSQDGYVAYSTNGNVFWTKIDEVLPDKAGNVQVIADKDFVASKIIYAAGDNTGQDIRKWQIGTSTEWTDIFRNYVPGGIYGLALDGGTLYALEFNNGTGRSTLWKCLSPATATRSSSDWSSSTTTAYTDADDAEVHLNTAPRALKASSGKLWAVKTNGTNRLYSFTDVLVAIKLVKPASGFSNEFNPVTGIAHDISFGWSRPYEASGYELQIAYDKDFANPVTTVAVESKESRVFVLVGPNQTGDARVNFMPGQTYYWRVRTTQPLYSYYSEVRHFTTGLLVALVPELLTPANGSNDVSRTPSFSWSPVAGASEYRFVLGDNDKLTPPMIDARVHSAGFTVDEELDYGGTYFWKVMATEPAESEWSTLANFTVKKEPAEPAPPPVVTQVPPPAINAPEPAPPTTVTPSPPPEAPAPVAPDYSLVTIIIAVALLLAVMALVIKFAAARPTRSSKGFGGRLVKTKGGLANYLRYFKTVRIFGRARGRMATADEIGASPISFAAASFLWMMRSGDKEGGNPLLSADEEQALGKILASRIQALARDELLYQKFPKDAALFLYLWSHYGSRDETNRYLTGSFQSRRENVIDFLKCYLTAPRGGEPGPAYGVEFSRTQFDAIATVVDPDSVYQALTRLYGSKLKTPDSMDSVSLNREIAFQFARIYQQVEDELRKAGKKPRSGQAGTTETDSG